VFLTHTDTAKEKTMGFDVVTMNMRDGSVQGHKAGCADLKRGRAKFSEPEMAEYVETVETKAEARASYNADFDYETDGWYEIEWAACAKHVPEGDIQDFLNPEQPEPVATYADPEHARRNFSDLAAKAGTEQGRQFWQAKADAI
jgi:hypothetical protein